MIRSLLALLLAAAMLSPASAQTTPRPAQHKKIAPYSARKVRKAPTAKINPHTGKPYGYGVPQDLKDGSSYLAPAMPMRRQAGYQANGGYNDNRARRPATPKSTNSSLNRDNTVRK